ncbi:MAG: translocation/assembly module TamB domain-containing protein [Myxacorys californica WJT36-NPBG1]|jgi:translocation and assembly module TamB|nr:translocation/assembly module TamB domain-containing protein [Myxacorys californica WJT36-NPBG1]
MSQAPPPEQTPPSFYRYLLRLLTSRTAIALSTILLLSVAGGAWWAWVWIHQELAPLIQRNLTELLSRPVALGQVERVSFTGIRFGASSVPATPTDADRLTTKAVEVEFSLLQLLLSRTLELNVTLDQPDAYLDQTKDGTWISTTIKTQEESGPIKTDLQSIRIRQGNAVLQPFPDPRIPKRAIAINQLDGVVRLSEKNQRFRYDARGQIAKGGTIDLSGETRPQSRHTDLSLQARSVLATDITRLVKLPVALQAGRVDGDLMAQLRPNQNPSLSGTATLDDVTLEVERLPQRFVNTNGQLTFRGTTIALNNVRSRFGSVPAVANGTIDTEKGYNVSAKVQSTTAEDVIKTLKLTSPVPVKGTFQADLKLQGELEKPVLNGTVRTTRAAQIDRVDFASISSGFQLKTAGTPSVAFSNVRAVPQAGGLITGDGRVLLTQQSNIAFSGRASNIPGDAIANLYTNNSAITIGTVDAIATVSGSPNALRTTVRFEAPQATYPGRGEVVIAGEQVRLQNSTFQVAGGTVAATGQLVNGQFQVSADAAGVALNRFAQNLRGQVSGNVQLSGNTNSLNSEGIRAAGRARLSTGGTIAATGRLLNGQFQASVNTAGVALAQFSQDLRGRLSGNVQLSGNTDALTLADVRAAGRVRFSEGLAVVNDPLTAQFRWNGQQVQVEEAIAPGLVARGTVGVQTQGAPQISAFNLDVQASGFDIRDFASSLPNNVALVGQADFNGRVTGTPSAPNAIGDLRLRNLNVNGLAFDPVLAGNLAYRAKQRTELQLSGERIAGTQDQIVVSLNANNRPTSFFIQREQTIARGRTTGETLLADLQNVPVSLLRQVAPQAAETLASAAGNLSGNVAVNLNTLNAEGRVAIANPRFGRIAGDEFRGQFSFINGVARLSGGELRRGESIIALNGTAQTTGDQPVQFQIAFNDENIQTLLQTLGISQLSDIVTGVQSPAPGQAADLKPLDQIQLANTPLDTRLQKLAQVQRQIAQQRRQPEVAALPPLAELQGDLSGAINIGGSLQRGLAFNFNVRGSDIDWGNYDIKTLVAQGNFANGVLDVSPVRLDINDGTLAFNGRVGDTLNGQLRVSNLPLELAQPFLRQLPVNLAGRLNATTTLSGSLDNPSANGVLNIVNGRVNEQPIQQANLNFQYGDARLRFDSDIFLTETEPLSVAGTIPIALPFSSVQPTTDQIQLQARLKDGGFALLNLFTDQVAWVDGAGQLNVDVAGTLSRPVIQGTVAVQNATVRASALPRSLTNVTGVARFNGDRVTVETLQAQFDQQPLTAQGILPILATTSAVEAAAANPLTVALNDLRLNVTDLYTGDVGGNVVVRGTAFRPTLGGTIRLSNGEANVGAQAGRTRTTANATATSSATSSNLDEGINQSSITLPDSTPTPSTTPTAGASPSAPIAFNDLQIVLANGVRVTSPPLVSFTTEGTITLNGTLAQPRPQGTVRLTGGQVNLFTTQFRLERGYQHTAQFTPANGLDPVLDVQLFALVPETTGSRLPRSRQSSEIADSPFANELATSIGTLRTIRVEAKATGPASQLSENLALTSSPARSRTEILALVGGGLIDTIGQAGTTVGIANIASTALSNELQGTITQLGQAIGLSELRIFPTVVNATKARSSTLSLAAEAIVDVSGDFSVSLSRVFASDEPLRYGVVYRINDETLVRGSTDLAGDSRAVVEYQTRF